MTRFAAYAAEALDGLARNRARSLLTMLGMVIGTASVIAVLGIGRAAAGGIENSLAAFGDPGFFVSADPNQDDPAAAQIQYRDAALVAAEDAAVVRYAFPSVQRTYRIRANGVDYVGAVSSQAGVTFDSLGLREGRRIDPADVADAAHVTLLSRPLERRLFGTGRALGAIVRIDGVRFRTIGVYDDLRAGIFSSAGQGDYIEIPYSTFGELAPGPVDSLQVYPANGATLADVRTAVERTLWRIHGPDARYEVQDAVAFLDAFERTIEVVGYGLTAIGGVALVVAGIGVMNIMLVSVAERRREIGIRKAIGASPRDIATQFLFEAVILALAGGGAGMLLGIVAVLLAYDVVAQLLGPAPVPWLAIVAVAVGFSGAVGIAFGTYPAIRASRLDPIDALRS